MSNKVITNKTSYDEKTKIWSGIKTKPLYGPECSIGQVALEKLLKDPDHISQICYHNGRQYTNREIANLSIRVAQHFKKLQVQQCDIIGLCATNSDFVAPLTFGALLAGLTISTLDPTFDKDGIKHIFSTTKPKIMFCDGAIYKLIKEAFEESNLHATIYTLKDHIQGVAEITEFLKETGQESNFKPEALKEGYLQTATILCSSGTTGPPKGVCMSHASLLNGHIFNLTPEDKILCFSTLYWLSGLFTLIAGTLDGATRVISDKGFSPEDFFDIIKKYKITTCFTPPSQMALSVASPSIKDAELSSVICYVCGGSAVPYALIMKMKLNMKNAEFIVGYGMSEVCGAIAFGPALPNDATGQITKNAEIKVIDDNGKLLGPEETGEICIRISFPWVGYYGNPEATKAIYEPDGWVHSGDIGFVDKNGHVIVVDRKKDILKYNNFHFFPNEIEHVITEIPGVAEVCVCGIPDVVSTYLPTAAIVKMPGSDLTEESVYQYVASKMAHFKHLHGGVYFMNELPKTASGKNVRRKAADICEALRKSKLHAM